MAETLEELTYDYEDEGTLVRKEIDRAVLTKGSWATVMFLFQELDRAKGKFRPPKMASDERSRAFECPRTFVWPVNCARRVTCASCPCSTAVRWRRLFPRPSTRSARSPS